MTEIASIVLYAADPERTAAFYQALGVPLADEHHDDGPKHQAAELDGVHVAIYPQESPGHAPARRAGGSVFLGFYVGSLDGAVQELARRGEPLFGTHEQMPWGCRVVAEDPDGRAVEINQAGHCPAEGATDSDR